MALPDGTTISVAQDGDFKFPNGAVLVKSFRLGGKLLETRLFVHHDDGGWAGYTYEWRDDQSDAVLLPAAKARALPDGTSWHYPSRAQCLECHTAAAGGSLGLEVAQLNGDFVYPATSRVSNQLETLEHIGLVAQPLGNKESLSRLPDPGGGEAIDARARSYLHANCSFCHRPSGGGGGEMDFRFAVDIKSMHACGIPPGEGTFGIQDAQVVYPGAPEKSLVSVRMHAEDAKRMPPVGVHHVDMNGVGVIDGWIRGLGSCPL
jgi:uncharacterized repeat protein (TIGR03806 family)